MPRPVRRLALAGGAVVVAAFVAGSGVAPAESGASTTPPTTAIGTALPGLGGLLLLVAGGAILGYRRADAGSRARSDAARAPRAH